MTRTRQQGLTLVELMIALGLGTVLIAGTIQIFLSGRESSRLQDGYSRLQENGRFALFFLQRDLRMAGFPRSNPDIPSFVITALASPNGTGAVTADNATTDGTYTADQLVVRYESDTDCLGQATPTLNTIRGPRRVAENRYFIDYSTGAGRLMCQGNGNVRAQPMLEGVQSLQVLYGEDTDGDSYANQYVSATQLGAAANRWANVVSARVAVLVTTQQRLGNELETQTHALLDAAPAPALPNGIRGRVFTTTVEVRNRTL